MVKDTLCKYLYSRLQKGWHNGHVVRNRVNRTKQNLSLGLPLFQSLHTVLKCFCFVISRLLALYNIMGFRKISRDLKLAAMRIHDQGILPVAAIIDCLQISRRTFCRILDLWVTTGDVVRHTNGVRGRPRILHFDDIDYLRRIIRHRPDWFLDELLDLLENNRFISAHFTTIHRELERAGVSTKKLKKIALECNENLRADYMRHMARYSPEQLGFLDEVSKDERTTARSRGRSRKGTRAVKKGVFVRGRRFSAEGLLTIDGMISNTVVEGSMTRAMFLHYLEFTVVYLPHLWFSCICCGLIFTSRCRCVLRFQDTLVFL